MIDHEEAVEIAIQDYQLNGAKLVDHTTLGTLEERKRLSHETSTMSETLFKSYTTCHQELLNTAKSLTTPPVRDLEKKLTEKYMGAQRLISTGRKLVK